MKSKLATCAMAIALAAAPFGAHALGKNEKGCLVGGAAGGVGGHFLGDHALLGAAAGCAVGTVVANEKDKKQQAAKKHDANVARNNSRARRDAPPVTDRSLPAS